MVWGKNSRNLTGSVEKKKISGRIQQNFRFLTVFLVFGAFAYSSKAPTREKQSKFEWGC